MLKPKVLEDMTIPRPPFKRRYSDGELAKCAYDETLRRAAAYPRLVESGRMSEDSAECELAKMEEIYEILNKLAKSGTGF